MHYEPKSNTLDIPQIKPADYGAVTTSGAEFDTLGWQYALVIVEAGVIAGSASVEVDFQSSAVSGSGHTDVAGARITFADDDDNTTQYGLIFLDAIDGRYCRLQSITAGTSSLVSARVVLFGAVDSGELISDAHKAKYAFTLTVGS